MIGNNKPHLELVPPPEGSLEDLKIDIHNGKGSVDKLKEALRTGEITKEKFDELRDELEERNAVKLEQSEAMVGRLELEIDHLKIALGNAGADELTGLHTRKIFNERLDASIEELAMFGDQRPPSNRVGIVLILIDLDNLKKFNDVNYTFAGDEALVALAKRLKDVFRDDDILARYGGDEFAVLLKIDSDKNVSDEKFKELIQEKREEINNLLFIEIDVNDGNGGTKKEIVPVTAALGHIVERKSKNPVTDKKFIKTIKQLMNAANENLDKDKKDLGVKDARIAKARKALGLS